MSYKFNTLVLHFIFYLFISIFSIQAIFSTTNLTIKRTQRKRRMKNKESGEKIRVLDWDFLKMIGCG